MNPHAELCAYRATVQIPSGLSRIFRAAEDFCARTGAHEKARATAEAMCAEVESRLAVEARQPMPSEQLQLLTGMMNGSQAKTAFALRLNCESMIAGNAKKTLRDFTYGDGKTCKAWIADKPEHLNCTGFLTLTVGDYVCEFHGKQLPMKSGDRWTDRCPVCEMPMDFQKAKNAAEANRRFNNLNRRLLSAVFERAVVVTERHKSGHVHFHALGIVAGKPDIRTGFNFEAVKKRDYRSASEPLRAIWATLREKLPLYGFGRAELTPIKHTGEAVSCYISKYIEKNVANRLKEDRGKKLVRYLGWNKAQLKPNQFSWSGARACAWRAKTRECAELIGCETREQAKAALGPRWAFHIAGLWQRISDQVFPGVVWPDAFVTREFVRNELAKRAGHDWCRQAEAERKILFADEVWKASELREAGYSLN